MFSEDLQMSGGEGKGANVYWARGFHIISSLAVVCNPGTKGLPLKERIGNGFNNCWFKVMRLGRDEFAPGKLHPGSFNSDFYAVLHWGVKQGSRKGL